MEKARNIAHSYLVSTTREEHKFTPNAPKTLGVFSFRDIVIGMLVAMHLIMRNEIEHIIPNEPFEFSAKRTFFFVGLVVPDTSREELFQLMRFIFPERSRISLGEFVVGF